MSTTRSTMWSISLIFSIPAVLVSARAVDGEAHARLRVQVRRVEERHARVRLRQQQPDLRASEDDSVRAGVAESAHDAQILLLRRMQDAPLTELVVHDRMYALAGQPPVGGRPPTWGKSTLERTRRAESSGPSRSAVMRLMCW